MEKLKHSSISAMLASNCDRPVVHEDVRLPQQVWRHPDILDVAVLGLVPLEVNIGPLL